MMSNEFTLTEAKSIAMNPASIDGTESIFMQGVNWGDDCIGTYHEWVNVIPENEEKAKATGFYDWYVSDTRYFEDDFNWFEYRNELLNQLRVAIIIKNDE